MFENPFWIGLYERIDGDKYEVCKITFGAEPKDYEVYDFLLKNWHKLKFSPPVKTDKVEEHKINPKRIPNATLCVPCKVFRKKMIMIQMSENRTDSIYKF